MDDLIDLIGNYNTWLPSYVWSPTWQKISDRRCTADIGCYWEGGALLRLLHAVDFGAPVCEEKTQLLRCSVLKQAQPSTNANLCNTTQLTKSFSTKNVSYEWDLTLVIDHEVVSRWKGLTVKTEHQQSKKILPSLIFADGYSLLMLSNHTQLWLQSLK